MSEAWVDSVDSEAYGEGAYDSEALGEGAYDSEAYGEGAYDAFGEESRSARRQRERQRQIMLARQRQAQQRRQRPPVQVRRPAPPAGPSPSPRQTITAIRSLDLETKVGQDSLRRALEASNRRAARATWAAVASAAVDQGIDTFGKDLEDHEFIKAGARFAPLLFLSPEKKRGGAEGFVTDPRVIGGAAILSLVLVGNFRNRTQGIARFVITPPSTALVAPAKGAQNGTGTISATAFDRNGKPVSPQPAITWSSSDPDILVFPDRSSGTFTLIAGEHGKVTITAQTEGLSDELVVKVKAAAA